MHLLNEFNCPTAGWSFNWCLVDFSFNILSPSTITTTICNIVCLLQVAWADRINLVVLVGVKWNMLKTWECVSEIVFVYISEEEEKDHLW